VVGHNDHLIVFVDDLRVSVRIFAVFALITVEVFGHRDSHRLASRIVGVGGCAEVFSGLVAHFVVVDLVRHCNWTNGLA
jgi:hypothetical protein